MALKQYENNFISLPLQSEVIIKEQVEKIAKECKTVVCYINNEPEHDYNIVVSNNDWSMLMDSIKNPKYNEKLADFLSTPLIF